jgi:glycerol-3-phosphate acyltransferase PlsY
MSILFSILSIIIGYIFGAFPSSYVIARVWGKIDLRKEGSSHVSATAVYRRLGWTPFIITAIFDLIKGIIALYIAILLTHSSAIVALTAVAAAAGHCWSVFIGFYGGLGATVMYGMMLYLAPIEFLISGAIAGIALLTIKRSDIATYLWLASITIALLEQTQDLVIALLPVALIAVQVIKRLQTQGHDSGYKDNVTDDFKRIKSDRGY